MKYGNGRVSIGPLVEQSDAHDDNEIITGMPKRIQHVRPACSAVETTGQEEQDYPDGCQGNRVAPHGLPFFRTMAGQQPTHQNAKKHESRTRYGKKQHHRPKNGETARGGVKEIEPAGFVRPKPNSRPKSRG